MKASATDRCGSQPSQTVLFHWADRQGGANLGGVYARDASFGSEREEILQTDGGTFPISWSGDGEDLEQNGAPPDVEVWPEPGDAGKGIDRQLEKGVEVLLEEVAEWRKTGLAPKPTYRSERDE